MSAISATVKNNAGPIVCTVSLGVGSIIVFASKRKIEWRLLNGLNGGSVGDICGRETISRH